MSKSIFFLWSQSRQISDIRKVKGSDLVHMYEDGTKLKIPSEITPPLFKIMIGMACNFLLDPALLVSLL